jgi:predicted RNA-binding protein with PIN domain
MLLVDRLASHLRPETKLRTCVVFDASNPPPGRPSELTIDGIQIRFAVGYPEADDLIEELIAAHHSPKQLAVVSSDHRIQAAAKRRGAKQFDSQPWLDDLMDNRVHLAIKQTGGAGHSDGAGQGGNETDKPDGELTSDGVSDWMREFGFDEQE